MKKAIVLLSGGLDSSLITAFVNKYYQGTLETYSIGMAGSEDLRARRTGSVVVGQDPGRFVSQQHRVSLPYRRQGPM